METSKEVFFAGQLKIFKRFLERNQPSNPSCALPLSLHFHRRLKTTLKTSGLQPGLSFT